MYQNKVIKSSIMLILAMGLSVLLLGTATGAEEVPVTRVKSDDIAVFDIDASITELNAEKGYVVIAEKRFNITEFMVDGKKYQTKLADQNGGTVNLSAFKVGQRVLVRGFELNGGDHIANLIQISSSISAEKEYRKIKKLKTIRTQ